LGIVTIAKPRASSSIQHSTWGYSDSHILVVVDLDAIVQKVFVTPLFGLNLFFNVEADFIALFAFFIGLFILAIHEIALVVSRRMT